VPLNNPVNYCFYKLARPKGFEPLDPNLGSVLIDQCNICRVHFRSHVIVWSEWQDLNLRPPRPERGPLSFNAPCELHYYRGRYAAFFAARLELKKVS
jgi:hypothetical protein